MSYNRRACVVAMHFEQALAVDIELDVRIFVKCAGHPVRVNRCFREVKTTAWIEEDWVGRAGHAVLCFRG